MSTDAATTDDQPRVRTLGELRASGWESRPVAEEIRANAVDRLRQGLPLIDGVVGYEDTVVPQLANAILARHDIVLLGERGQAKTRMVRGLVGLLDEWMPIVAGSEINDDPYAPVSRMAKDLVELKGDDTPIDWVHRSDRYGEKLATPDTSIADLIGEVDPIKVAEGRYLSDELTLHYGLIPRTNRGVFAVNELPDLAERIQVGLLNVLEERDVQIRGYKVRLPLDVMLVATANPEDYTNRGRLITPLKDRFGAQIRTHYPLDVETEIDIMLSEVVPLRAAGTGVVLPDDIVRIVATVTHLARTSPHISQSSGVSVRMSIANLESVAANAMRRALSVGDEVAVPRIADLAALAPSTLGKVEMEALDEGREGEVLSRIVSGAVVTVFRERVPGNQWSDVVNEIEEVGQVEIDADMSAAEVGDLLAERPVLSRVATTLVPTDVAAEERAGRLASAAELVLEGLHLSRRLNKDEVDGATSYRPFR